MRSGLMRLDGRGGRALELSIDGYQFPGMTPEPGDFDFDANWLVVKGRVNNGAREWTFRHPCLLTDEAHALAAWLEAVANDWRDLDGTDFTEPNLEFRRMSAPGDAPVVRVTLRLEARPPGAGDVSEDDWDKHFIDLELSRQALMSAASDLRDQLKRYPQR
jgi:hypothetical protein